LYGAKNSASEKIEIWKDSTKGTSKDFEGIAEYISSSEGSIGRSLQDIACGFRPLIDRSENTSDQGPKPKTTAKPVSSGESPFQREYVGGKSSTLTILNQTDRLLTLNFGGVKYAVPASGTQLIEVDEGRYEFSASVPRARPTGGVEEFMKGYRYTWRFYIVRR
jgi:hypothetical protein